MKIYSLKISGFRRLKNLKVLFGDATFLIGPNNAGKSSVLKALDYLLSGEQKIPEPEYFSVIDEKTGEQERLANEIVLEAEFRNVPVAADEWRGFKGRVFRYEPDTAEDTGRCIFYRKTYRVGENATIEMKSLRRSLKPEFEGCKSANDFVRAGLNADVAGQYFRDPNKNLSSSDRRSLENIDELFDVAEGTEDWFQNPGGIVGNVLNRLPKFILIPADTNIAEIDDKSGVLAKTLNELFKEVRDRSENYKEAQVALDKLASELDPTDEASEFGNMMGEVNKVLGGIFPETNIHASANLSNPDTVLKPTFDIEMSSNVKTKVSLQGTGMIRSAAFGLLRYREEWLAQRNEDSRRTILIGFEEPEIYLHPSAANQMRNMIYDLSADYSQIVATTHSPYLIDLSRKPKQVLNRFVPDRSDIGATPFSVTDVFRDLMQEDRDHIKMVLKLDDYVSRAFFTDTVIVIEGDTEELVIKEALRRYAEIDNEGYLRIVRDFEVIKARGKAVIISFVRYLKALGIKVFVIHDRDKDTPGAAIFNPRISEVVGDEEKIVRLEECMEDVLGYRPPSSEKPYRAYSQMQTWGDGWEGVPNRLKEILRRAFDGYIVK